MRATDFTSTRAGTVIRTPQGYDAFVPHKLPPALQLDWNLSRAIAGAERALGHLAGIGTTLHNPHLLISPFVRKEAVLSSRIEGTQASLSDLFIFDAAGAPPPETSDVREVASYVTALETALERAKDFPISLRFLRDVHLVLMQHAARAEDAAPGEFRRSQNWIGVSGARLDEAIYVPPPANAMESALSDFELYLHEPPTFPFVVWLALIHYQFEAIHPFRDGNGRLGRLLLVILMSVHGVLPQPLLYLSAFFEKHRSTYYDRLLAVSQRGEWEEWIRFFLRAVEEQANDAVMRSQQLHALRDSYRAQMKSTRSSGLLLVTLDELFKSPAISISLLAQKLDVTYRSAQQIIEKLLAAKIVVEATGRPRNRVYYAPEIFRIVEA